MTFLMAALSLAVTVLALVLTVAFACLVVYAAATILVDNL